MVHHSRAGGYRLRLGEVSATELNFFRLREFWTKGVYIVTNEPDENATGADWEWLIGHGNNWVQIRVQAKIVNRHGSFAELGHPHRTGRQMDRLIDPDPADVLCRWLPLYVFYAADPPAGAVVPRNAGCSAQLATRVRTTYGKPPASRAILSASAHLPGSIPWADIFDGLVLQLRSGRSLSEIVANLAHRPLSSSLGRIGDFWDENVATGTCGDALPSYIQQIVRRDNDQFDASPMTRLEVDTTARYRRDTSGNGEITEFDRRQFVVDGGSDYLYSSAQLPARSVVLEPSDHPDSYTSLPSFVSVIDIDRLGDLAENE